MERVFLVIGRWEGRSGGSGLMHASASAGVATRYWLGSITNGPSRLHPICGS